MALTTYTAATDIIKTLGTNPEDRPTLTDDTFKAKFDENSANIKVFLNAMIAELLSTANGKGASQIGIEDSGGRYTATNAETALAEIAGSGRTTETVKGLADLINTKTNQDGWVPVSDTWTYASATTITVPSGAALKYRKGDKIKLIQTTVKCFYIVGVADTVLTITAGSSYTLTNAAISAISYSHNTNAINFPDTFALTAPTFTSSGTNFTVQPTSVTAMFKIIENVCYYNISGLTAGSGTGTGYWILTFTAGQFPVMGYDGGGISVNISAATFGFSQIVAGTNNVVRILKYDGTAPTSNGSYFAASGSFIF